MLMLMQNGRGLFWHQTTSFLNLQVAFTLADFGRLANSAMLTP